MPSTAQPDGGAGGGSSNGEPQSLKGVVYNESGQTLPAATVVVQGAGSTTTDASGRFTLPNVRPPYDLIVIVPNAIKPVATMITGLTRLDVVVTAIAAPKLASPTATLTGTLTGRVLALPAPNGKAARATRVSFTSGSLLRESDETTTTVNGDSFTAKVAWSTPVVPSGSVFVLQTLLDAAGYPADFSYGHTDQVTLVNNASLPVKVELGPVDTTTMNFVVQMPADYNLRWVNAALELPNTHLAYFYGVDGAAPASIKVPRIPGARILVMAGAGKANTDDFLFMSRAFTVESTATISFPTTAPTLSLPLAGSSGIDLATQTFTWASVGNGALSEVLFDLGNLALVVITPESRVTLPDFSKLGLGSVPAVTNCRWLVTSRVAPAGIDGVVNPQRNPMFLYGDGVFETTYAQTSIRSFTSK